VSRAELSYTFDGAISVTVKSFLLRILQEFIQNSLKHAGAKLIRMTVESDNGDLVLIASDDGNGFDAHNPGKKGMGLSNMERRVQLMGGSAVLTSEIGKGTRLNVRIPEKKLMTT
jgi:signal transduction histidine kinase